MTNTPEQSNSKPESSPESGEAAADQLEKLANKHERAGELSPESGDRSAEKARVEALDNAISVEAGGMEKATNPGNGPSPAVQHGAISNAQKAASYKKTMDQVQTELTPGSRAFSKVIHNKAVETTSELVGSTIARPNAVLAGAVSAFVLTLGVYVMAKTLGYQLSGFETIGAFIVGWVLGITYDYLRLIITGQKS